MNQTDAEKLLKQRVLQVLNECKISVNKLAGSFGARQTTLNDQINGNSKIGAATLVALINYCPDLSAEWLLRGEGEMLITSESETETSTNFYERIIAEKEARIKQQERELAKQDKRIEELNAHIAELKGDIAMPHRSAMLA